MLNKVATITTLSLLLSSSNYYVLGQTGAAPITAAPNTSPPITSPPIEDVGDQADFRCGLDPIDAEENCGNLCTFPTDCAPGTFCFSSWNKCYLEDTPAQNELPSSKTSLPEELRPQTDFRCGVSEVDARSNCKSTCLGDGDCTGPGERCWTTHNSYCHIMPDGHPQCDYTEAENTERRCGFDEMASRGFCGAPCDSEVDCTQPGEKCFPVHLNLCSCFEQQDAEVNVENDIKSKDGPQERLRSLNELEIKITNRAYFEAAKEPLEPYFTSDTENNNNEGTSGMNDNNGGTSGINEMANTSSANHKKITTGMAMVMISSGIVAVVAGLLM